MTELLAMIGLTVAVAWLLLVGYGIAAVLLGPIARLADRARNRDRRRHIAACQRREQERQLARARHDIAEIEQAEYRRTLDWAMIELAGQLPATLKCPEAERR